MFRKKDCCKSMLLLLFFQILASLVIIDRIHICYRCDLLWADPSKKIRTWGENEERNISVKFGSTALKRFLKQNRFDLVCRAHVCVDDGYDFFSERNLVTVFSAPDYMDYDNNGAIMCVDQDLCCSFKVFNHQPFHYTNEFHTL